MSILITGGDGLVGQALRSVVADTKGLGNVTFATRQDADLTQVDQTADLFERVRPTHVIHGAAIVGGIGGNIMHSGEFFTQNIAINTNVLEQARVHGIERLTSFMSTCVFPDTAIYPLTVDQLHQGAPHPSNFAYAYAKRMLDVQSRAYRAQWDCDFVTLIPTNIYGPHDNWSLSEGHVIPSLIHKVYLAKAKKDPLVVWGSGKPLREFVFSEDIARLALWALDNYRSDQPLILSSGIETTIADAVATVCEAMGFEGQVVFDSEKPDGQFRKPSDTGPLRAELPAFEFTDFAQGIRTSVNWFFNNYPHVRM